MDLFPPVWDSNDADMKRFISACQAGTRGSILCSFLIPETEEMQTSTFFVTDYKRPKFME